jgi:hypothetical protein
MAMKIRIMKLKHEKIFIATLGSVRKTRLQLAGKKNNANEKKEKHKKIEAT